MIYGVTLISGDTVSKSVCVCSEKVLKDKVKELKKVNEKVE